MTISCRHFTRLIMRTLALLALTVPGCAHDTYQERADIMKNHSEAFYTHLRAHRVEAAVHENQKIEAMADQMAETVRKRAQLQGTTHVEREFALMKTARETSAQIGLRWASISPSSNSRTRPVRPISAWSTATPTRQSRHTGNRQHERSRISISCRRPPTE